MNNNSLTSGITITWHRPGWNFMPGKAVYCLTDSAKRAE